MLNSAKIMVEEESNKMKECKNGVEFQANEAVAESEPCIEEKKADQGDDVKKTWWNDAETVLRDKSGLTRRGLHFVAGLLLTILILLIVVVALGASWPHTPHHQLFPVCKRSACLRASAQVQESLNPAASPCNDDLWQFACGGWLKKNQLPVDKSVWSPREQLAALEATRVRDLLTTLPLPVATGTVKCKLKYLYEACLNIDNVNADGVTPLMTIISELGGWPILRNFNPDDFDYAQVLKQLQVKYGVYPYFKITVVPNPDAPDTSSIRVSPSGLGLPDKKYYFTLDDPIQKAYIQLIRDIVIILGKSTATNADAEIFAKNMFHYEQRIAEITPESIDLLNPVAAYNPLKISELAVTDPKLPLQHILTEMFPDANIGPDSEIVVTSPDYLSKISQIISTTDRITLNSYIIWTLVREYVPYLSSEFISALDTFNEKLLGVQKPIERWEFCANLVSKRMGLAVGALLEQRDPIDNGTKRFVQELFESIKSTAIKRISNLKTFADLQRHLKKKINSLQIQIGLPENVRDDRFIKDHYSKFHVLKANLFSSLKHGVVFEKKVEEERLIATKADDHIIEAINRNALDVAFFPSSNTIYVPRSLLKPPVFELNYPRAIIYGRLGFEISKALTSSLLPFNSAWSADRKLLTLHHTEVNESISIARPIENCLRTYFVRNQLANEDVANLTSLETLKDVNALRLTLNALNMNANDLEHVHQPSLETYEDNALFFLTHSQTRCANWTVQHEDFVNKVKFRLNNENLLKILYSQVPEFSTSFDCQEQTNVCDGIF